MSKRELRVISNQKMNEYLEELGELVGIEELIRKTYYKRNKCIDNVGPNMLY